MLCSIYIYTAGRKKRHLHAFLEIPVLSTTQRVPGSVKSTCREVKISESANETVNCCVLGDEGRRYHPKET